MGIIEFCGSRERMTLAGFAIFLAAAPLALLYNRMRDRFAGEEPATRLGRLLFSGVGDGGARARGLTPRFRFFLSALSVVSLLLANAGLLLGILVLAGAFDPPRLQYYAAAAAAALAAGVLGAAYSGNKRGWPG